MVGPTAALTPAATEDKDEDGYELTLVKLGTGENWQRWKQSWREDTHGCN